MIFTSLNNYDLNQLLSLDDDNFKALVSQITQVLGADKSKSNAVLSDVGLLKSKLSTLSTDDINKLLNMAGREKSEEIYNIIKGK